MKAISDIALLEIREALEGLIDRNNMEDPTRRAIFLYDFLKSGRDVGFLRVVAKMAPMIFSVIILILQYVRSSQFFSSKKSLDTY